MLDTVAFGNELKVLGFDFYSGVPCSFLKNLINYAINECEYIGAPNEGDAVSICAGVHTGGRKAVVLMQNSGLTNTVSPLTSLNFSFKFPVLGFVSLRGEKGLGDEPQHELMGQITTDLLEVMDVKWEYLSPSQSEAKEQLKRADDHIKNNQVFFFVVKKGTFEGVELKLRNQKTAKCDTVVLKNKEEEYPTRISALNIINQHKTPDTVQLLTTGKSGRELYEIEDSPNNLYMVGSMGCIGSFGLGLALVKPDKKIVVLDGDGALLMRMGIMGTIGYHSPENMLHIVLDNNSYDSTGGQSTISHNVDFVKIAESCGYKKAYYAHNNEELSEYINKWNQDKGLTFITIKIAKGSKKNLGRPKVKPFEVKDRLMEFIR